MVVQSIESTPYVVWTGITFGAKLVIRQTKKRPTTADPNRYDGIFLGYTGTTDNVRYWNLNRQQEGIAKHKVFDELHYGTNPKARSPASKHLIETITGTPHHQQ
mmetsp:Transcript_22945/g.34810  ORF Transcript_22945/g.34810 Transcript_22945/m.34810 type:complete len:104 (-) Transcript_22945:962-1273(-)